jgi:Arc/MetJ-type ribon-helix-helix transcriptional regulator
MHIELTDAVQQRIDTLVESGKFDSREAVVVAAVAALESHVADHDFEPGELVKLLAEGEASIAAVGTLDGATALRERIAARRRNP